MRDITCPQEHVKENSLREEEEQSYKIYALLP
jgi:hypothetical protein